MSTFDKLLIDNKVEINDQITKYQLKNATNIKEVRTQFNILDNKCNEQLIMLNNHEKSVNNINKVIIQIKELTTNNGVLISEVNNNKLDIDI